MAAVYDVHSYHINVGAGDAAIHLLIKYEGGAFDGHTYVGGTTTVLKAVMIDAGDLRHNVPDNVAATMTKLSTDYSIAGGLKLDAVIVTHWDSDHYKNLIQLILSDISLQLENMMKGDQALVSQGKLPKARTPEELQRDVQVSFFKYNKADNSGPEDRNKGRTNPMTTFY